MEFDIIENASKKIGLFTDLHCGVEKDSSERLKETEKCIDWIVKTFLQEKVKWIFFLGDWFDSRFSINTKSLNVGINCIEKLSKNFEKVFLILGNHDAFYKNTNEVNSVDFLEKISSNKNIKIISQKPFYIKLAEKTLGLYPWASELLLLDESKNIETCDFGFGHFEANGFLQPGGISSGSKTDFIDLFKFGTILFSGHYHINKLYSNVANKNNKLLMLGSPLQLNWSDYNLKKSIFTLDVYNNKLDSFENNINASYQKIYYSKLMNKEYSDKELSNLCSLNYIKLVIDQKYEFNEIVKFNNELKKYNPRTLETEYLISLTSDLINKSAKELVKTKAKTNIDYLKDYVEKIYPEIIKIDGDIKKQLLLDLLTSYYNKAIELEKN